MAIETLYPCELTSSELPQTNSERTGHKGTYVEIPTSSDHDSERSFFYLQALAKKMSSLPTPSGRDGDCY